MSAIWFALQHKYAAIWLGCGLGKTVITLTALKMLKNRDMFQKTLVIAPKYPALTVWAPEAKKWDHLNDLKFSVMVGTPKKREKAFNTDADIYVINRENVPWLVDYCQKNKILWPFRFVVVDELSSFKSPKSQRLKALLSVRPYMERIIGLTGTPTSNGLMDLWAEYRLLDGGERLGRYITPFRETFFNAIPIGDRIYKYVLKHGAEPQIYSRIGDMTLSMKTVDYLDMPELVVHDVHCALTEEEQAQYDDFAEEFVLTLIKQKRDPEHADDPVTEKEICEIFASSAGVLAGKLCQCANGAIYSNEDNTEYEELHKAKTEALEDLIESHNGQPVLICYWFKHDRERIAKVLDKMDIPVREINTEKDINDWNEGRLPVALIHPARAGHGLNLQKGGNSMIWFSLTWSLELYQQTVARIFRQGQNSDTVTIHRIITDNTIDEQVASALSKKENVQNLLLDAMRKDMSSVFRFKKTEILSETTDPAEEKSEITA